MYEKTVCPVAVCDVSSESHLSKIGVESRTAPQSTETTMTPDVKRWYVSPFGSATTSVVGAPRSASPPSASYFAPIGVVPSMTALRDVERPPSSLPQASNAATNVTTVHVLYLIMIPRPRSARFVTRLGLHRALKRMRRFVRGRCQCEVPHSALLLRHMFTTQRIHCQDKCRRVERLADVSKCAPRGSDAGSSATSGRDRDEVAAAMQRARDLTPGVDAC